MIKRVAQFIAVLGLFVGITACGGGGGSSQTISVVITGASTTVNTGGSLQFSAVVTGTSNTAIGANAMRLLEEAGVPQRDLPRRAGVSREAMSVAVGFLTHLRDPGVARDIQPQRRAALVRTMGFGGS